jgi:hypothetical protein
MWEDQALMVGRLVSGTQPADYCMVQGGAFPAGTGARAHGLRAEAGAPFLSFFLS